jgi:hypothetical protein
MHTSAEGEMDTLGSGVSFIYILYRLEGKTEPCGRPAHISQIIDILPSTETINLLF